MVGIGTQTDADLCVSRTCRGRTWDVLGAFCPDRIVSVEVTGSEQPNTSSDDKTIVTKDTGSSLGATLIYVIGVFFIVLAYIFAFIISFFIILSISSLWWNNR